MSAYICDRQTILKLAKGAAHLGVIEPEFILPTADMLWKENIVSVLCRYPDDTLETAPGPRGENYLLLCGDVMHTEDANPPQLLELIGEYAYQSCEHEAWPDSKAAAVLCKLKTAAQAALVVWEKEQATARQIAREAAQRQFEQDAAKGREMMAGRAERYAIVAELHESECDSQTDYYASRRTKTVVLALSDHKRDLFKEMRKAAALHPETAHLGPGKDVYRAMKLAPKGDHRHWCGPVMGYDAPNFETREEAQACIDAALARDQAKRDAVPFEPFCPEVPDGAEVDEESIEHRQKWSMGSGYFLQAGSKYSGWRVSKTELCDRECAAIGRGDHCLNVEMREPVKVRPVVVAEPEPVKNWILPEFVNACYIG